MKPLHLRARLRRLARWVAPHGHAQDWLLLLPLAGGVLVAALSNLYAPMTSRTSTGGQVIRRQLTVVNGVVATEHFDVREYADFTVLARTLTPNTAATLLVSRTGRDANRSAVNKLQSVYESWTRWDEANSYADLRVLAEPATPPSTAPVIVELLIYLRR